MAGEQEIITRFKGDISELSAAVDAGEKKVSQLEEPVVVPVQLDDKKLSASLGSAQQKFQVLDAVAKRTGESGAKAGDNIAKGMSGAAKSLTDVERLAKSDLDLVKALIVEASKTPKGAAALAKDLNSAQQAALKVLVGIGALSKEEAEVAANAQKIINAQKQFTPEVTRSVGQVVNLRTQLQNARNNLAQLIEGGTATQEEIRAAAVEAGNLQDRFEDVNATINAFNPDKKFQALTGILQNVVGGFAAVQGVVALVGGDADKLGQSLLKVQAALAVTQGLQSLFGGLKDNLKIIRLLFGQSATAAKGLAVAEVAAAEGAAAQGVATGGLTGALNTAKLAAQRLYATLIANPFVAVAAAIGLVVAGIVAYTSSTKDATETTDELIARLDRLSQREKFVVDRRAQENILQSERIFLEDKAAALKLNTEEERKAAIAQAQANKNRRDAGIEQKAIEQEIADAIALQTKLEEQRSKKRREFTKEDTGNRALRTTDISKDQQAELTSLTERIQKQRDLVLKLNADLNNARQKSANEVVAGQLDAEQARLDAIKGTSDKVVKVSEDEAAKRIALANEVAGILQKGENEIFLAGLSERERKNAQLAQEFDDRVEQIREAFAKLRKLAGEDPAQLAAIEKAEGDAIVETIRQQETEALNLKKDFDAQDLAEAEKHSKDLLDIERQAAEERAKLQQEEQQRQRETLEELSNAIDATIALLAQRNAAEEQANEERLTSIQQDFAARIAENEAFDQSEQNRARKRNALLAEQDAALAAEQDRIAGEQQAQREARSKELINLLLDELEKIVLINAVKIQSTLAAEGAFLGPGGVVAGLAQGAVFALLIKALFAGVKAAVQGAYEGEELVGSKGEKPIWSGRDGYLRRVHKNEGIIDAETNVKYLPILNMMRGGRFEQYMDQQFAMRRANEYLGSDDGQRMAISVMPSKFQDKNIVGASENMRKEQKRTNELLALLVQQKQTHRRRWNAA